MRSTRIGIGDDSPDRRALRRGAGAAAAALAIAGAACTATDGGEPAASEPSPAVRSSVHASAPRFDAAEFVSEIDNPLFPLEPGAVFRLRGRVEGEIENETIVVTHRTKEIMGVRATVVKDVVRVDGELAELTYDWYAQDRDGNVWYLGEDTAEYQSDKVVSREGSWEAGVDGAEPGIIMNADPTVTDSFRQEFYEGHAEDMYWVVETDLSRSVPAGSFDGVVRALEWTPLEPAIVAEKLYAPGTGLIAERALSGPPESFVLVSRSVP